MGTYTAVSKISWWADFEILAGEEGSLARAFLGLSLIGLIHGSSQNKQQFKHSIQYKYYLGTNTSSSSDSQLAIACFFPPAALTEVGIGGGVISIL